MVFEKIRDIVANQFDIKPEEISMQTSFRDDLNADSLDLMELIMNLEDEFELEVEDEDVEEINTMENAVDYINKIIDE